LLLAQTQLGAELFDLLTQEGFAFDGALVQGFASSRRGGRATSGQSGLASAAAMPTVVAPKPQLN
jgi:hypothetical protein